VFIGNPDRAAGFPDNIPQRAYGLTPAEARLALALFEGRSLGEFAEGNRVSRETVRSQMKSIFLKTGTRRQAELVSLLAGFPTCAT
jgi:DNA-binding CsgD family transcriptional regulator